MRMSRKRHIKKKCFSRRRNVSLGRTFQSLEPATRNVRTVHCLQ